MEHTLTTNKKIAIIGGGPVGLTTARLLQMKGVDVTVYERDKDSTARVLGGTLDLHKSTGQKALEKAGLLDEFYKNSRPTGQKIGDKQGNIVADMKPDKTKPEIDRPVLRNILLNSLSENTVIWDRQVVKIDKRGDVFELEFQNGDKVESDVVIVADGGRSKVRKYITETLPEETGTYVIQGEIADFKTACSVLHKIMGDSNLAIVEDKKSLFLQTRGDGSVCFYVSFRKTEQWLIDTQLDVNDISSINQFLRKLFNDWSAIYVELFEASSDYIGFPLRVFHANEIRKSHENITVVGDAAHVMPPFGGLGVNMGLVDALTLTENLTSTNFSTIQAAIESYEQKMVDYALPVQQETHLADDRIHSQYEHSFTRIKARFRLKILKVIQYVALLFLLLVVGVFWGNWFSFSRSYDAFSATELIHIAKTVVQNLALPMRFISMICLLLMGFSIYFTQQKKSKEFYFSLLSLTLLLLSIGLTVIIEVPINNQIISWTSSTIPSNWEEIRNHWQFINSIRTFASLLSFGFFSAAVLKPFNK